MALKVVCRVVKSKNKLSKSFKMCFNIMYSVGYSIFFKKDNRNNGRSLNSELVTIKKVKTN